MDKPKNHDVRMKRYGCSGLWVRYVCHTCNAEIDTGQTFFLDGYKEKKDQFFKDHPCQEIKNDTRYRIADYLV